MRIFLACQQSPRQYAIPAYRFWRSYFRAGLTEAGHTVLESDEIDWAMGIVLLEESALRRWRAEIWERVVAFLRRARENGGVDLFLSYLYPKQIDEPAIRAISGMGVPCVNFFCDHVREYRRLPGAFAPFDLHWVPEYAALALYQKRRWPFVYAPMPCWVPPECRTVPVKEWNAVGFIGSRDSLRASLLAEVAHSGLPLEIRGSGWQGDPIPSKPDMPVSWSARWANWLDLGRRQGPAAVGRRLLAHVRPEMPETFDFTSWLKPQPIGEPDYRAALAECAVSLGINRFFSFAAPANRPGIYSRLRDIEAPMLGACYLTEWTDDIPRLYEAGKEIETYRDSAELIGKARELLADPERRKRLRAAGQRRALAEHTVGESVKRVTLALGLKEPS